MQELRDFTIAFPGSDFELSGFVAPNKVSWFQAKSVCDALGFTNPTRVIKAYCDEEEYQEVTNGRGRPQFFLTESAVYDLILESKTIASKALRKWLSREVLPSIRKNGYYLDPNATRSQLEQLCEETRKHRSWEDDRLEDREFRAKFGFPG